MNKRLILSKIFFLLIIPVFGQESFWVEISGTPNLFPAIIQPVDGNSDIFVAQGNLQTSLGDILFLSMSEDGLVQESYFIDVSIDSLEDCASFFMNYRKSGSKNLFTTMHPSYLPLGCSFTGVFIVDLLSNEMWGKKLSRSLSSVSFLASFVSDTSIIVNHFWDSELPLDQILMDSMGLVMFNVSGEEVWNYFYKSNAFNEGLYYITTPTSSVFPDGSISILGAVEDSPNTFLDNFFVLKLDASGNIVLSRKVVNNSAWHPFEHFIDHEGNVYVVGKIYDDINEQYNGFLLKLNSEYEVLWSKMFYADHYNCLDIQFALGNDNTLFFAYVSEGYFPVIFGKMSLNGELFDIYGFSAYSPRVEINADGSFYFSSSKKYLPDGSSLWGLTLAKSDSLGLIESCPEVLACLKLIDINPPLFEDIEWIRSVGTKLPDLPLSIAPANIIASPYCGSPTPPHPYFVLPDTICAGDCLTPDSTYNRLAHQVEWYITGPGGLDTTIIDTTFTWCFDEPGHYQVEQGIWLLGCSDYYLRDVVVLPDDLAPALGEDRVLCEQPPYSLSANASRPLRSYLWSDGSIAAELAITASGTYWLEASDGYCMLRDTVELTFLEDLLDQGPALSLPTDTSVCEQHLPYILLPQSPYAEDFSVPAISNSSASSFELWQAGSYEVQAELFGCPIRDTFALEVNDCRSRIYFPTAFSPNGDGLNDLFLPQGKDYEGIELQVYDRWGGLLFSSQSPPFAWDGADAAGGVYVYRFRYFNTLALQEEEISGQVVLLR